MSVLDASSRDIHTSVLVVKLQDVADLQCTYICLHRHSKIIPEGAFNNDLIQMNG